MLLALSSAGGWQRALDAAAGTGACFSRIDGAACITYWPSGVGRSAEGSEMPEWTKQRALPARCAAHTAVELRTCRALALTAPR
jgi:hypothetical protein